MAEKRPNVVIFCGAGFSHFAGLPLMGNFADRLRASGYLGAAQLEFDQIQLRCDSLGAFIGGSARNLEQLASFLSVMELTMPSFRFPNCSEHDTPTKARELVMRGIQYMVTPKLHAEKVKSATSSLFVITEYAEVTFVTTNYDLVLEIGGVLHGKKVVPTDDVLTGARRKETSGIYGRISTGSPRIVKLHGSANWLEQDEMWVFNTHREGSAVLNEPEIDTRFFEPSPRCVIVPPTVLKPGLSAKLASQWLAASAAIASADYLWFIGYSFPETDSFMRYFLASALSENAALRQLVIVDPSRAVCSRGRAIFTLPSLRQVTHTLPVEWEDVNFSTLLGGDVRESITAHVIRMIQERDRRNEFIRGTD